MAAPCPSLAADGYLRCPPQEAGGAGKLAYFVHDLNDDAVHRRLRMLRGRFSGLEVFGFRRGPPSPASAAIDDLAPTELGRTADGRFLHRAGAVLREAALLDRRREALAGTQVFLARQFEMLALAAWARRRFAPDAVLAYECLDIHRLMVAPGAMGRALRAAERRLLKECDLLVVSSPGFVTQHFAQRYLTLPPVYLLENKMLASEIVGAPGQAALHGPPPGPPWRIGWYGVIRCRRSLALLAEVARRFPGLIEVVIRGRPALDAVPDFAATVADCPGLSFGGPYDRARELPALYGDVHFTWAMDFFEAGANSDWLLPNRLYEGGFHGAVPLALGGTETGRWLAARGAGVLLDEPLDASLPAFLHGLDQYRYSRLREAGRLPHADLVIDDAAEADFAAALTDRATSRGAEPGLPAATKPDASRYAMWCQPAGHGVRHQPSPARPTRPASPHRERPFVSILVPMLNEEQYIEACLKSLLTQWPDGSFEILVLDGGSTDRSPGLVLEMRRRHPQISLIDNPGRTQAAAVNLGARIADRRAKIILRADAHALYPPNFVQNCTDALRRSDAASVVVPMRTEGRSGMQRAMAEAQNSPLGNGGAAHRRGAVSGFIDHGHHAVFDRAFFMSVGGYDESFTHNEDAELDHRIRLAGGRIWMCAEATVTYFPRRRLRDLARQYARHGRGRARTLLLHRIVPRPRQVLPVGALLGTGGGIALAPASLEFALIPAFYAGICLAWGAAAAVRERDPWLGCLGIVCMVMHLSWAAGFLRACLARAWPASLPPQPGAGQPGKPLAAAPAGSRQVPPGHAGKWHAQGRSIP